MSLEYDSHSDQIHTKANPMTRRLYLTGPQGQYANDVKENPGYGRPM